jgi:hypothetical protein
MTESEAGSDPQIEGHAAFGAAVGHLGPALLGGLDALEQVFRRLHPPDLPSLRRGIVPARDALDDSLGRFEQVETPDGLDEFRSRLTGSARLTVEALSGVADAG